MTYIVTSYQGRWAVMDTVTRVYYYGFANRGEAQARANSLNREDKPWLP